MSKQSIEHSYHFGREADQYTFYRLPKALFMDNRYKSLSDGAKILYGLMLDRMGLSMKNEWLDAQGRVYIYFTLEDIMEYMGCQRDKGMKMLAELDTVKGVGLIERVRQGLGKPTIIYVKKFIQTPNPLVSEKPTSAMPNSPTPVGRKNPPLEVGEADTNKTECSHNDSNDNNPIESYPDQVKKEATSRDGCDMDGISTSENHLPRKGSVEQYRREVRRQIDYPMLLLEELPQEDEARINEMVEIMVETMCSSRATIRIAGDDYSAEFVKARFSQITNRHVWYVMECMNSNTTHVRNIKKYLLTALFNAPITIGNFAVAEYNHFSQEGGARDSNS